MTKLNSLEETIKIIFSDDVQEQAFNKIVDRFMTRIKQLEIENTNLKQQLSNKKYLDRDEVDDFVKEIITVACSTWCNEDDEPLEDLPMQVWEDFEVDFDRIITAICNLAIPKIDEEKIRHILLEKFGCRYDFATQMNNEIDSCLDEIIKEVRE